MYKQNPYRYTALLWVLSLVIGGTVLTFSNLIGEPGDIELYGVILFVSFIFSSPALGICMLAVAHAKNVQHRAVYIKSKVAALALIGVFVVAYLLGRDLFNPISLSYGGAVLSLSLILPLQDAPNEVDKIIQTEYSDE